FADEVIHAYATERVLALGTPKLWITLWFMLLVYYNFNIQGTHYVCPHNIGKRTHAVCPHVYVPY
ncbi:hypothetical protein KZ418_08335, partial [Glaesserella parasuis]|nr:hypothetical protein [Glaesserella parasuis]